MVGGEDQPVAGSEGAVTLLLTTQRRQFKFHHYVFHHLSFIMLCTLCVIQDEIYHSSKGSSVIGLLDIYGFEVLQHNRYELYSFICSSAQSVNQILCQ